MRHPSRLQLDRERDGGLSLLPSVIGQISFFSVLSGFTRLRVARFLQLDRFRDALMPSERRLATLVLKTLASTAHMVANAPVAQVDHVCFMALELVLDLLAHVESLLVDAEVAV